MIFTTEFVRIYCTPVYTCSSSHNHLDHALSMMHWLETLVQHDFHQTATRLREEDDEAATSVGDKEADAATTEKEQETDAATTEKEQETKKEQRQGNAPANSDNDDDGVILTP